MRRGIIIVNNTHALHPKGQCNNIRSRANKIISEIRKKLHAPVKDLIYEIDSFSTSGRSNSQVLRTLFNGRSNFEQVRVVFSDQKTDENTIIERFSGNKLIVTIEENLSIQKILSFKRLKNGCCIYVSQSRSRRLIEDIFIDIYVAQMRSHDKALIQIINSTGLEGLFRQKAKYFRKHANHSWLSQISKKANYAPLAALNQCDDDDIVGRAEKTIKIWQDFCDSVTINQLGNHKLIKQTNSTSALASIKKIGGQLPIKSMERTAQNLPNGEYLILILRKSSQTRRKPKTKNKIMGIFGKNARINSFRFYPILEFSEKKLLIIKLIQGQFAIGLQIFIKDGKMGLKGIVDRK